MRRNTLILLLLVPLFCIAQYSNKQLYNAYLNQDMSVWGNYIRSCNWSAADNSERERLLNYSYGYIAYAVSEQLSDAPQLLNIYKNRLDEMQGQMPESRRLTYLSAYYAYAINYNKIKTLSYGKEAINLSLLAVSEDPEDPIALNLQGNILFYSPKLFGGNKEKALLLLLESEKRFKAQKNYKTDWNYRALQLTIAQCYEKTGKKAKAIELCQSILKEEPKFSYIRDTYLPTLEGREPIKEAKDINGSLSGMILN